MSSPWPGHSRLLTGTLPGPFRPRMTSSASPKGGTATRREKHFSLLAGRFGLGNGRVDLVERVPASGLGFEDSVPDEPGDGVRQLAACFSVEPGQPVAEPENLQNTAAGQDVARILAHADRLGGQRAVDEHS